MSKTLQPLTKWMPIEILEYENIFKSSYALKISCLNLINNVSSLLNSVQSKRHSKFNHSLISDDELYIQHIEDISSTIEETVEKFNKSFQDLKVDSTKVHMAILKKLKIYRDLLWKVKLKLCYMLESFILEIAHLFVYYGESLLTVTLRIATSYNNLLSFDMKFNLGKDISVCNNTCPYLLFPLKKFSVTRLLQILARNRAELCCHKLIDCLLETYKLYDNSDDDNSSDNSSLEIYMALTKHMSPRVEVKTNVKKEPINSDNLDDSCAGFVNLEELISSEETNVLKLLSATLKVAPSMLGTDGLKKSKNNGTMKINNKTKSKVLEYYEQILWAEVGNFLEHVILWWAASPLSARPPHSTQHLREWIIQFIPTAEVPSIVLTALTSLADALGVHVTSTMWDQQFRLALVASKTTCNPETGKLFGNVLQDLVMLGNQCETTPDWILGAPLDELPLVEQIPVLHRLDHSVHTTRLWAVNECKKIANTWNMDAFFAITHSDIVNCLSQLDNLRLNDHTIEIQKGGLGVHVEVCALMRTKLVSEVKINVQKLKDTPKQCVEGLASVCKTISLASLQMIFPTNSNIWYQENVDLPDAPSCYVQKYLSQILTPVLVATDDHVICNMILTLICESWLDHIYINKIKFSQHGAIQLLCDFAYVTEWLNECGIITQDMRKKLVKNEILMRCEGVGKLLLRSPGERLKMVEKHKRKSGSGDSTEGEKEQMPAEMYVPNQEQWLELRAIKKKFFIKPLCCGGSTY